MPRFDICVSHFEMTLSYPLRLCRFLMKEFVHYIKNKKNQNLVEKQKQKQSEY